MSVNYLFKYAFIMWAIMFVARSLNWNDWCWGTVFAPLMFVAVLPLLCDIPYIGSYFTRLLTMYSRD